MQSTMQSPMANRQSAIAIALGNIDEDNVGNLHRTVCQLPGQGAREREREDCEGRQEKLTRAIAAEIGNVLKSMALGRI